MERSQGYGLWRPWCVIAVDANILIYAHRTESLFYKAASARLRELAEGRSAWAILWPCMH